MTSVLCDVQIERVVGCIDDADWHVNQLKDLRHSVVMIVLIAGRIRLWTLTMYQQIVHFGVYGKVLISSYSDLSLHVRHIICICLESSITARVQKSQVVASEHNESQRGGQR